MSTSKLASVLEKKIQQFESRADNGGSDPEVVEMFANMRTWLEEDADTAFYDFEVTHEGIEIEVPRLKKTALIYYFQPSEQFNIRLKGGEYGRNILKRSRWYCHNPHKAAWIPADHYSHKSPKDNFFRALNEFFDEMPLGEIA